MATQLRIHCVSLLVTLLLPWGSAYANEKAEEQGRPVLKAAAERSLLHADDLSPFRLKLSFTVRASKVKQIPGAATWLVSEKGWWRRDTVFSDYTDLEVGRGPTSWVKRSLDFKPLQAIWIEGIFSNYRYLDSHEYVIDRYFTISEHHVELRCVDLRLDKGPMPTLCVDPQGNLVRVAMKDSDMTYEYSDYRPAAQKSAPYRIVLRRAGDVVLDGQIERLSTDAETDQSLFEPPAGATKRDGCLSPTLPKLAKKVAPDYPMAARKAPSTGNGHHLRSRWKRRDRAQCCSGRDFRAAAR
jgi:hypothetical protein